MERSLSYRRTSSLERTASYCVFGAKRCVLAACQGQAPAGSARMLPDPHSREQAEPLALERQTQKNTRLVGARAASTSETVGQHWAFPVAVSPVLNTPGGQQPQSASALQVPPQSTLGCLQDRRDDCPTGQRLDSCALALTLRASVLSSESQRGKAGFGRGPVDSLTDLDATLGRCGSPRGCGWGPGRAPVPD
jgi:hypothetical protein